MCNLSFQRQEKFSEASRFGLLEAMPQDFHHPFEPYAIQQEFMSALYACIEDGCVGIFESPTGVFDTLSTRALLLFCEADP